MSILSQLKSLKTSVTNVFDINIKNKKSLIYEDGSSISRAQAYETCKQGFLKLCKIDSRFTQFENLYSEETIDMVPQLLNEDKLNDIKKQIKLFLCLVTPYLETRFVITSIEWLVYKYEIHHHQPQDILMSCLPYHNHNIFIKFLRLLDCKKKEFSWLSTIAKEGKGISVLNLSSLCLKDPNALEMICSWPIQIIELADNDQRVCKELCHVIICLAINILDKVKLLGEEKIEKYISPFVRIIIDGLNSTHTNFNSSSIIILAHFSEFISLDRKFVNNAIKRILKNANENLYVGLRAILDVCYFQEIALTPKLNSLFMENLERLNEKEKSVIEELMLANEDVKEEYTTPNIIMEIEQDKSISSYTKTDSQIVKEITKSLSIEWDRSDIETQLIELLKMYVINWVDIKVNSDSRQKCKSSKISFGVLKLFKQKPKELKISYNPGGLISYLCLALLYPDIKIKKISLKLIKLFGFNWPKLSDFAQIKSNNIESDPDCIIYSSQSKIVIEELEFICSKNTTTLTESVPCLSLINHANIVNIPIMPNIWSMFLSKLRPDCSIESNTHVFREALVKCLHHIQSSYSKLSDMHQQQILTSITNDPKHDEDSINCAIEYMSQLPMSVDNITFLLQNIDIKEKDNKKKTMKKFKSEPVMSSNFYSDHLQDTFTITLSAFCRISSIPANEQVMLIDPIVSLLGKIVTHFSLDKMNNGNDENSVSNGNIINLVKSIMLAMLSILTSIINSTEEINLDIVSNKVRLEVFTKCLYLFQNSNLNELNLSVIQNIVKLGLGLEQFNLIYFISWIGNHLVPREDHHSLTILSNIINETLPLCIKQKKKNSCDKVQIIVNFINECKTLPKHRVLLFFKSVVKALSLDNDLCNSSLWIQILFMVAIKSSNSSDNSISVGQNECLIVPLLSKFPIEEQIFTWKTTISFLGQIINDPGRKRKFIETEVSSSPANKKRKTTLNDNTKAKIINVQNDDSDFMSVKENLLAINKKIDAANLLRTIMKYCLMHLKENGDVLLTTSSDVLKDFISTIFTTMKQISRSSLSAQEQNEFAHSLRQSIECVGSSLSRNLYLSMIVDLSLNDTDESVKSKCIELLSNKFASMAASKQHLTIDSEILEIVRMILPMAHDIIGNDIETNDWNSSLLCVTHLLSLGFYSDEMIGKSIQEIFKNLIGKNFTKSTAERVIITNIFFKNYVDADCYENLVDLFNCSFGIIDKCIVASEFNNGELESGLAFMYTIISREDSHKIGWEKFIKLLAKIFELVSIDCRIKKLSQQSCEYQKQIRIKLSKMADTKSLVYACRDLTEIGVANNNVTFISGSVSLFGCHITHLNKIQSKYIPDDEEYDVLWALLYRSLSLNEVINGDYNLSGVEEISIKALNQICYLFEFDSEILNKLFNWVQKSDLSPEFYLERNIVLFKFIKYLISKSSNNEKVIEFVNSSDCIICACSFLKHLSLGTKIKRRKIQSTYVINFTTDHLTSGYPKQCSELIKSICDGLLALFTAENKRGMNLSSSDDSIDLITNVCKNMLSIDQFMTLEDYQNITEKHMIPLIVQIASNSSNDESLLTPLALGLCKHFTELSSNVHLAILKTLSDLKTCLGNTFDTSIKDNVSSFLEDCKLHDDERVADLANEIV